MADKWDFGAWATKCNLKCIDGRTIKPNAFADQDGTTVPIMWNHFHDDPELCVGKALLHNRPDGVYMYGAFNDTEKGKSCRELVRHGDIVSVSINANRLRETVNGEVLHGNIKEVSLVLAGANPGALIDKVLCHSADGNYEAKQDEAVIYTGLPLDLDDLEHSSDTEKKKDNKDMDSDAPTEKNKNDMTIPEVYESMTDEQKAAVNALVGQVLVDAGVLDDDEENDEEDNEMKHNAFDDAGTASEGHVLTHADGVEIINRAKQSQCGSLRAAVAEWTEEHGGELKHAAPTYGSIPGAMMTGGDNGLFPDYQDVRPGAPELITRDQTWIGSVINGVHKSPISRIRTRQMDVRGKDLRAKGYKKGNKKTLPGNMKLLSRTTDPQTVYRTDALNRDDYVDITGFDVAEYMYGVIQQNMYEDIALAITVGDGREAGDDKIDETHIRPIWKDDDLFTIHYDIDLAAAKKEIQGTNTSANFGENYIFTEAFITASLYSREQYKGSGGLTLYCTPRTLNKMLLSKDLNGRRIYSGMNDLMTTLNVKNIITAEQFEGLERTTTDGKKKKLLGLYVNLQDYSVGSTKGGQLTRFEQFDIDFNLMKYLLETRLSGALTRVYSAIAIEEDVTEATDVAA